MMIRPLKIVVSGLLGAVVVFSANDAVAEKDLSKRGDALSFSLNEHTKTDGRCAHLPKTPCTQIKVSYPLFRAEPSSTSVEAINQQVKLFLLQSASSDQVPNSIDEAMVQFLQVYQDSIREFPHQSVWTDEKQVEVLQNRPNLLSLQYSHYWYSGGAHPNSSQTYWNYDSTTGQQIQLSDLFREGYAPKLNAIAERHFRKVRGLEADASLNEAGFWFEENQFKLNNNFAIAPKGLIFFFNTYEIGPYVMGPTEVLIPYEELKTMLKEKGSYLQG